MEYLNYILIGIIAIFFIQRFIPVKGIRNITTTELKNELKDKNKQFIDVRTVGEYSSNHIPSFKNIPLHELKQKSMNLDKTKEVVVICQSGMRSMKASKLLKKQGFERVTNVTGGVSSWGR
jgi:rhodanese-related sulfurtransferase